ncbi:MAG: hypothetical protein KJP02_11265, partial [Octadecabacter sp.]|nr:hypothetical protein [Octadecabacter sp.]
MIKTAYLAVLLTAGLLAFGLFALVRGTGGDMDGDTVSVPADTATPAPQAAVPVAEPQTFHFLAELSQSGITLDDGLFTLALFGASADGAQLVVRDAAALAAAQADAVVTYTAGSLSLSQPPPQQGAPAKSTFAQAYRDDRLVATVTCPDIPCTDLLASGAADYAGLLQTAI